MLLFSDLGPGFSVYRTTTDPSRLSDHAFSVERLGKIAKTLSGHWEVYFDRDPTRYRTFYSDLTSSEKRGIIRLLDHLNRVERPESDNLRRWHEIMGLDPPPSLVDVFVSDCENVTDNEWSDIVTKIEAARADNTLS